MLQIVDDFAIRIPGQRLKEAGYQQRRSRQNQGYSQKRADDPVKRDAGRHQGHNFARAAEPVDGQDHRNQESAGQRQVQVMGNQVCDEQRAGQQSVSGA